MNACLNVCQMWASFSCTSIVVGLLPINAHVLSKRLPIVLNCPRNPPTTDTNLAPPVPLAPPQVVVAEDYECLSNNGVGKENSMRNITVSVTDETYKIARIWAAQRDRSLSSVVEYLLRTLPNIERAREALPPPSISNSGKISQNSTSATTIISITSAPEMAQNTPSQNLKFASEAVEDSANLSN
jgi:hypothetical protein